MNYSIQSVVPAYSFHSNNAGDTLGNRFAARPLRQWRKQLHTTNGLLSYRRASVGMPMDKPGGLNVTTQATCVSCNGVYTLKETMQKDTSSSSACNSCHITRTGLQKTLDSSQRDYNAYLESKCKTYDQMLAYNPVNEISYFTSTGTPLNPTNSPTGTQVRTTNYCYGTINDKNNTNNSNKCHTTIYKPNNVQFAKQGGVSSGSHLSRLNYNTLNNYGAEYNSATGAIGVNTGRYQSIPTTQSYYNKLKPQKIVYPYKIGNSTYCRSEYKMCMND